MKNPELKIRITFPAEFKANRKVKVHIDTHDSSYDSFDIKLEDTSIKNLTSLWAEIREMADDPLKECFKEISE